MRDLLPDSDCPSSTAWLRNWLLNIGLSGVQPVFLKILDVGPWHRSIANPLAVTPSVMKTNRPILLLCHWFQTITFTKILINL